MHVRSAVNVSVSVNVNVFRIRIRIHVFVSQFVSCFRARFVLLYVAALSLFI